ncbi:hypothetical protein IEQ34_013103 [Dendrobium chrysotoxum]|uniref:RNase III domain-containing protein n=1 Tax=Dendrobium chrysotoxum TaxID=161865 RepID=A0AAV7GQG8_DENCH|nr:hypothetical protein IEQ34_013103 [Dendrobium chrysotoxum]
MKNKEIVEEEYEQNVSILQLMEKEIKKFMEGMNQYPIHSNGLLDPLKAFANIVESVIGAIFIDINSSLKINWNV